MKIIVQILLLMNNIVGIWIYFVGFLYKKKKKNLLFLYGRRFGHTFRWKFSAINDILEKEKEMMPLKVVLFGSKKFTRDRS